MSIKIGESEPLLNQAEINNVESTDSSPDKEPVKTYGNFSGYAVGVNYIVGTGVFGYFWNFFFNY